MKKIILAIVIILVLGVGVYLGFFRKEKTTFSLVEVARGNITQEVSETGKVIKGEEVNLSFKTAGRIEKIYVKVGDQVKSGEVLVKLDTRDLEIQLQEAKASLSIAQAKLNKLLAGSSIEEIQIAKTTISNTKIVLESAQQNLKDVQALAEENLNSAYGDAQNYLDDAYLKSYNAFNTVDLIQRTYFTSNDQEGLKVKENKNIIENALSKIKSSEGALDVALSETKEALEKISSALKIIREICEEPIYRNKVSSTDKTALDNHRSNMITALTNVVNSQQTISQTKLTNQSNINTAKATLETKEGQVKTAEDELARILAPPRREDIDLSEAQLKQAQAQLEILENQIKEAVLRSLISGQITKVNKRIGEIVQPIAQDVILTLLPLVPYEIKVDVYEENVVKINVGNPVEISLVAFPRETFKGKIISIGPAEKIIEDVVYYEVTIGFEKSPENIKPGLTADVIIQTDLKEDVLIIHRDAVQRREGKTFVEVLKDGLGIEEKEIEIGLTGSDDMVEVLFGLEEGEKIVIWK